MGISSHDQPPVAPWQPGTIVALGQKLIVQGAGKQLLDQLRHRSASSAMRQINAAILQIQRGSGKGLHVFSCRMEIAILIGYIMHHAPTRRSFLRPVLLALLVLCGCTGCAVVTVAGAAVSVATTAVGVGVAVVGTVVDVGAAGVKAVVGSKDDD